MSDMMTFPDTWEEFEKLYGFNDVEEIYTNNSRLIPSYRVKQWLDHLPSVQPRKGKISYTKFCEELWGQSSICSLCGCSWQIADDGNDNFCPNCGCRMEEGDTDDR